MQAAVACTPALVWVRATAAPRLSVTRHVTANSANKTFPWGLRCWLQKEGESERETPAETSAAATTAKVNCLRPLTVGPAAAAAAAAAGVTLARRLCWCHTRSKSSWKCRSQSATGPGTRVTECRNRFLASASHSRIDMRLR